MNMVPAQISNPNKLGNEGESIHMEGVAADCDTLRHKRGINWFLTRVPFAVRTACAKLKCLQEEVLLVT